MLREHFFQAATEVETEMITSMVVRMTVTHDCTVFSGLVEYEMTVVVTVDAFTALSTPIGVIPMMVSVLPIEGYLWLG